MGPRALRVHGGSGRTGISSGIGPVGFYTALSGGGSRRRRPPVRVGAAAGRATPGAGAYRATYPSRYPASGPTPTQAYKAAVAQQAADAIQWLTTQHHEEFPLVQRPVAVPVPVDADAIRAHHREAALAPIGRFDVSARSAAKGQAAQVAESEIHARTMQAHAAAQAQQQDYDRWWQRLLTNDPEVVMAVLAHALMDNRAPASPVSVEGSTVSVLMSAPQIDDVPDYKPHATSTGVLTTKRLTRTERNDLYRRYVGSHLLATIRETLAMAPSIERVRVVVVRNDAPFGAPDFVLLLAASFWRSQLAPVPWTQIDPIAALSVAQDVEVRFKGQAKELAPLRPVAGSDLDALLRRLNSTEVEEEDGEEWGSDDEWADEVGSSAHPAGWFPDPYGRYELRYWDGGTWSAHVSRGGVAGIDRDCHAAGDRWVQAALAVCGVMVVSYSMGVNRPRAGWRRRWW